MRLPAPYLERMLEIWPVARLATLRPDGSPHLVPIVFVWHAGALWSPIDGKPKREAELARLQNLRRDPRACVLLDRYASDWSRLWWIQLQGRAEIRVASQPERDPELEAPTRLLRAKYPQYRHTPLFRGEPTLLRIVVERRGSWCASEHVLEDWREL